MYNLVNTKKKNIYITLGLLTFHSSIEKNNNLISLSLVCFCFKLDEIWIQISLNFHFDFNLILQGAIFKLRLEVPTGILS